MCMLAVVIEVKRNWLFKIVKKSRCSFFPFNTFRNYANGPFLNMQHMVDALFAVEVHK